MSRPDRSSVRSAAAKVRVAALVLLLVVAGCRGGGTVVGDEPTVSVELHGDGEGTVTSVPAARRSRRTRLDA